MSVEDAFVQDPGRRDEHRIAFSYGHGRLPFFMKLIWVAFLTFATWYVVTFLLEAFGREVGS